MDNTPEQIAKQIVNKFDSISDDELSINDCRWLNKNIAEAIHSAEVEGMMKKDEVWRARFASNSDYQIGYKTAIEDAIELYNSHFEGSYLAHLIRLAEKEK